MLHPHPLVGDTSSIVNAGRTFSLVWNLENLPSSQTQGGPARRNGVSVQVGISDGGFRSAWRYPAQRALGLQQGSKFTWKAIQVKAEVLVLASGNNQCVVSTLAWKMEGIE